jgi:hypothetical protein
VSASTPACRSPSTIGGHDDTIVGRSIEEAIARSTPERTEPSQPRLTERSPAEVSGAPRNSASFRRLMPVMSGSVPRWRTQAAWVEAATALLPPPVFNEPTYTPFSLAGGRRAADVLYANRYDRSPPGSPLLFDRLAAGVTIRKDCGGGQITQDRSSGPPVT